MKGVATILAREAVPVVRVLVQQAKEAVVVIVKIHANMDVKIVVNQVVNLVARHIVKPIAKLNIKQIGHQITQAL